MAAYSTSSAVRLGNVQINMELEIGDWNDQPFYSACRQTVNSEAVPLNLIPNDGVDEFILKAENCPTLVPEIADENGTLRALVGPKYLPRPRAPQAPVVAQVTVPSRLDKLYEKNFRRLELALEARSSPVPASVNEGRVATLNLVGVSAEGEAAFESTLEVHVAAPAK